MNKQKALLPITTFAMAFSFAVWAVFSPLASTFQQMYGLTSTQKSILVAIPVLLGSIMRIPLGILTDRYGGRKVFSVLLLFIIVPLIGAGFAHSYTYLLFWAFFIGMAGTSFAVSIAFVSRLTPPEKQGTALGINAMGNIGTAIASFSIPSIAAAFGVKWAFWGLIIPIVIMLVLIWFFTPDTPKQKEQKSMLSSLYVLKYKHTWILSLFYFVTFGAFVAFGIYLPSLLVDLYGLTPVDAGLRAAGFTVIATLARPIGGILGDKIGAERVLTVVYAGIAIGALGIAFGMTNIIIMTIACLFVAVMTGLGNGAVFKLVPQLFPKETGTVTGVVGAWGGLGGFFPPILMGIVKDMTGSYVLGFILLGLFAAVCFMINRITFYKKSIALRNT
ncbi:NarK/NasA family nitrate transporter [Anoxybacillus kestanbolensis]|uniref:MFS transporter n=1 Tax=Anoxybacillus kestanbolensis TaxID=227476 RepID=UPI00208DB93A|nr:nitrate/nitrite transporter [Anoxybacillus kestanbolensis]MCL9969205.1 NarK/NasA family nitrate transporter [Anoxybacillus kestanbolensis]